LHLLIYLTASERLANDIMKSSVSDILGHSVWGEINNYM